MGSELAESVEISEPFSKIHALRSNIEPIKSYSVKHDRTKQCISFIYVVFVNTHVGCCHAAISQCSFPVYMFEPIQYQYL